MPVVHIFSPSISQPATPFALVAHGAGFHVGRVGAVVRLGQAEGDAAFAGRGCRRSSLAAARPCRSRASVTMNGRLPTIECSFCRSLCRPRPLAARCSRITAIHRSEPSLAARIPSARRSDSGRRSSAEVRGLAQQLFPFRARQAAVLRSRCAPIRADDRRSACCRRPLPAGDLRLDEGVEPAEVVGQPAREIEVHVRVRWQGYSSAVSLSPASAGRRLPMAAR